MLSKSDINMKEVMAELAILGVEAAYIVPTITGLEKSILDAHEGLRNYFKRMSFHDYGSQQQGTEYKLLDTCFFITENEVVKSKVSLYKPQTKSGDPRIWFSGLTKITNPNEIIAIIFYF